MPATLTIGSAFDRTRAASWCSKAPEGTTVKFYPPKRTIPQNDRFWAMLTDVAEQVEHNGRRYSTDDWKVLFMHACEHEIRFIEGLNGEPFPVGFRSSKLSKEQMAALMDYIEAWGTQNGVVFKGVAA